MKNIAAKILKFSARLAIKRNNYKVVAITGSVGKTSTKKAVSLVLKSKYSVLSSDGEGYNTEIGIPLALLKKTVPQNKIGWFFLIFKSPFLAIKKRNYDFCVLEMGADKPGDIEYLTQIARPDVAVVTNVSGVHLLEFKSVEKIAKEKEKILLGLRPGGVAVLNIDNKYTKMMNVPKRVSLITFGKNPADIRIIGQEVTQNGSVSHFRFQEEGITISSTALGEHILYIFAAAVAVGISQKIEIKKIIKALEEFKPARGRLNTIDGINRSIIIDDSYNANPASMRNAIDVLAKFQGKRKIALLGSMNELGEYEKEAHEKIGEYLAPKCDILVTVGEAAEKYLASAALQTGIKEENIFTFKNSLKAGEFLKGFMEKGDVILAKGSQNKIRIEKAVKKIMENPKDAPNVLCRQSKEWETRE